MTWLLFNLRLAYSTELGAATAYRGHARATKDPAAAARIAEIEADELRHRAEVGLLLERFGASPFRLLEVLFWCIGTMVGFGCRFWGDWASAYGAAQFEWGGAADSGRCSRAAEGLGLVEVASQLREFQCQEAEHREYFLDLAARVAAGAPGVG